METLLRYVEPHLSKILTESVVAQGISERAFLSHCEGCIRCNSMLLDIQLSEDCRNPIVGQRYCDKNDQWFAHINSWVVAQKPKKKSGRYELGAREFTLTYSPKWFDDAEARTGMIQAIHKLIKYYKDEIITLRAVGEVGTNGLSHVHCFYKLQGGLKMTDKNFKRAWKYWNPKKPLQRGFEGGHHASVKNESDFLGYIDKDIETAWFEKTISSENYNNAGDLQHA